MDPFAAMINHSCDPNALWHFEGRKLSLIAVQDFSPGMEITVSYIKHSNYNIRQQELQTGWGFTCTCFACEVSKRGINSRPAFNKIIHALPSNPQEVVFTPDVLNNEEIKREEIEAALFHLKIHLANSRIRNSLNGNRKEALRSCVREYTLVNDMQPMLDEESIQDVLYHMAHLVYDQDFDLHGTISFLKLHLWQDKMERSAKFFGKDTSLYQFEKDEYVKAIDAWEIENDSTWITRSANQDTQDFYIRCMYLLQRWAGETWKDLIEQKTPMA
jgi:hypothetical protein